MTKDKYNLFRRRRTLATPSYELPEGFADHIRQSKVKVPVVVEKPEKVKVIPKPVLKEVFVMPPQLQITSNYVSPALPAVREVPPSNQSDSILTQRRVPTVATSAKGFFSNLKGLDSKPLLRIPEKDKVVEEGPPPAPGSKEAKLRNFIKMYF